MSPGRLCSGMIIYRKEGKQVDMPCSRSRSFLPGICVGNLHLLDGDPVTVTVTVERQQQVLPSWDFVLPDNCKRNRSKMQKKHQQLAKAWGSHVELLQLSD